MRLSGRSKMIRKADAIQDQSLTRLEESEGVMTNGDHSELHRQYRALEQKGERLRGKTNVLQALPRAIQVSKWLVKVKELNEEILRKSNRARSNRMSKRGLDVITNELENMNLDPTVCCAEFPLDKYSPEKQQQLFEEYIKDLTLDESKYQALCNEENRDNAKNIVGYTDLIMTQIVSNPAYRHLRRRSIHLMKKLCEIHGIYPTSFVVPRADVRKVGEVMSEGASARVWEGVYGERRVALKEISGSISEPLNPKLLKSFCREVAVWKYLDHPNITRCHGVLGQRAPLCIVSSWMVNGTVASYIESHREASRLQLIRDIVAGLCYLHEMGLVHGDLKSLNILVDENGTVCLADFGFAAFSYNEHTEFISKASAKGHTPRWAAPELLGADDEICPTTESDVYSLSMVMWEVFTGRVPFYKIRSISTIEGNILNNKRPERPLQALRLGLTSEVWGIMERCWQHDPKARPTIGEVQQLLDDVLRSTDLAAIEVPVVWPLELS